MTEKTYLNFGRLVFFGACLWILGFDYHLGYLREFFPNFKSSLWWWPVGIGSVCSFVGECARADNYKKFSKVKDSNIYRVLGIVSLIIEIVFIAMAQRFPEIKIFYWLILIFQVIFLYTCYRLYCSTK